MISLAVSLSAWNALSTRCFSVSTSDGRHWGSGGGDLLKRHWARTLSKTRFGSSSLSCGWSEIFVFTVAKVIALCSISSLKTVLIRASLSSFHEPLEVLGTTASEADGLGLTEVLFGLDGLTVHALCCAAAWRLELRTCSFPVDGNICLPSADCGPSGLQDFPWLHCCRLLCVLEKRPTFWGEMS